MFGSLLASCGAGQQEGRGSADQIADSGQPIEVTGQTESPQPTAGDPATWRLLDPDSVSVETQAIRIGVTRVSCAGGKTGRVLDPVVTYESEQVLIRTDVEPLASGIYNCQGNEEVEVDVVLDQPVGERDLLDAACQDVEDHEVSCETVFQWAYPRGEPVEISTDPYLIATTAQEFVDWGSHIVWGEVVAEREVEPRYPATVGEGEVGREVDLHVWDVTWSHPDAVTPLTWDQVVTVEVSPGWTDGQPAVLEGDTRLEVGHVYTLVLVDSYDGGEQYLSRLLGSITEFTTHEAFNEFLLEIEGVSPDPDLGPRPEEPWDARFMRGSGY